MQPLTVKILGSGGAAQKHRTAFEALPGLYRITDDLPADIVSICTINAAHFEQTKQVLASGAHAIVEKPLCASLHECDELSFLTREYQKQVFPIFQYRFAGHEPVGREIITRWSRGDDYYAGWRGQWQKALGGCLTSHGIHLVDLSLQAYGMPSWLKADMDIASGVERFAEITMDGHDRSIITSIQPGNCRDSFHLGCSQSGFIEQFRMIHGAITKDGPPPVTLEEGRQSMEVLTAAYWSAYAHEPVSLPIKPDHPFYCGWSQAMSRIHWQR